MICWLWIHWESLKSPPWPFLTHTWLCHWRALSCHPALCGDCSNPKSTHHKVSATSYWLGKPQCSRLCQDTNQGWHWFGIRKCVQKGLLKLHMFSESISWLNLSPKGARVGICGQVHPSGLTSFWKVEWVFFFGCPGKFVQNIRKQNKVPKVGFSWVSLCLERKQLLWCEHLPKLLKSIWAGWERLGAPLMQWNVAPVFVVAASIKGGRTTLPLTIKCFHENGNECYRGLFPLNAQGSEVLKGCFHYTINRASYSLSFFPPSLFKSSGARGWFFGSARQCCVFPASQGSKSHCCSQMGPAEIHPLSSFQLHFLRRETAVTHLVRRGRL